MSEPRLSKASNQQQQQQRQQQQQQQQQQKQADSNEVCMTKCHESVKDQTTILLATIYSIVA
jgi:hypothetical protein